MNEVKLENDNHDRKNRTSDIRTKEREMVTRLPERKGSARTRYTKNIEMDKSGNGQDW